MVPNLLTWPLPEWCLSYILGAFDYEIVFLDYFKVELFAACAFVTVNCLGDLRKRILNTSVLEVSLTVARKNQINLKRVLNSVKKFS